MPRLEPVIQGYYTLALRSTPRSFIFTVCYYCYIPPLQSYEEAAVPRNKAWKKTWFPLVKAHVSPEDMEYFEKVVNHDQY